MKLLMVTPPATGEINPLLAICQELIKRGHEIHIASGSSLKKRFDKFRGTVDPKKMFYHDLGSSVAVEDYTSLSRTMPERFHKETRHRPQDLLPWLRAWEECVWGSEDEWIATARKIADLINEVDPDMVAIDSVCSAGFDGARLTGRPFIVVCPASSGTLATPTPFREPLPMAGIDWTGSWGNIFSNLRHVYAIVNFACSGKMAISTRRTRRDVFKFKPLDFIADAYPVPAPALVDEVCAAISFNVQGLDFLAKQSFADKVFFVGTCLPENQTTTDIDPVALKSLTSWIDEAERLGEDIVYINFGSIFLYTTEEYDELVSALEQVHAAHPSFRVLWKVPEAGKAQQLPPASQLPDFIRREGWLPTVDPVYNSKATSVIIHHGGGNTFNEAVSYGIPQLVCSQWVDTHDFAAIVKGFGIGLRTSKPPYLTADDIAPKLLTLLQDHAKFKKNAIIWQLKSRHSGGTKFAADIIETQMFTHGRYSKELELEEEAEAEAESKKEA